MMSKPPPTGPTDGPQYHGDPQQALTSALAMIPASESQAYRYASSQCSNTMQLEEANPRWFWLEGGDAWSTAKQLVCYWNERVALFGSRAFLPLRLEQRPSPSRAIEDAPIGDLAGASTTTMSALQDEDLVILHSGAFQVLPDDKQGRTVFFIDQSKLPLQASANARLRAVFYLLIKALSSKLKKTYDRSALRLILLGIESRVARPDDLEYATGFIRILSEVLPYRVDWVHVVRQFEEPLVDTDLALLQQIYSQLTVVHRETNFIPHVADEATQAPLLLKALKEYGFSKRGLPALVCGSLADDYFDAWLKKFARWEGQVYMTEEERLERKRGMNAVHSRKKRQRRRAEYETLEQQKDDLEDSVARGHERFQTLSRLLDAATQIVSEMEQGLTPNQSTAQYLAAARRRQAALKHTQPIKLQARKVAVAPSFWDHDDEDSHEEAPTPQFDGATGSPKHEPTASRPGSIESSVPDISGEPRICTDQSELYAQRPQVPSVNSGVATMESSRMPPPDCSPFAAAQAIFPFNAEPTDLRHIGLPNRQDSATTAFLRASSSQLLYYQHLLPRATGSYLESTPVAHQASQASGYEHVAMGPSALSGMVQLGTKIHPFSEGLSFAHAGGPFRQQAPGSDTLPYYNQPLLHEHLPFPAWTGQYQEDEAKQQARVDFSRPSLQGQQRRPASDPRTSGRQP